MARQMHIVFWQSNPQLGPAAQAGAVILAHTPFSALRFSADQRQSHLTAACTALTGPQSCSPITWHGCWKLPYSLTQPHSSKRPIPRKTACKGLWGIL